MCSCKLCTLMQKRILSLAQYAFFLGGGFFLVWWQLKSMSAAEKSEFYTSFSNTNYWLLIPVIIMSLLSHLSRSMRWKLMMETLDYKPSLRNVFAVTMVGYLANSAIPRLGEVLKCSILARYEKLKVDKLFGTILIERTFDFGCYILFIALTVLIQIGLIGDYVVGKLSLMTQSKGFPVWGKLILIIVVFLGLLYFVKYIAKKFPHNKLFIKVNSFIRGVVDGFKTILKLKRRKEFIAHTIFIWSMYTLQIYIGFFAMEGTSHLDMKAAFSVLALATLAMIVTPGGIGSFPIFVMETLLIYSVASPVGKAFGWLIWGANTSIVIIAGLIALLLLPYFNKTKIDHRLNLPDKNLASP